MNGNLDSKIFRGLEVCVNILLTQPAFAHHLALPGHFQQMAEKSTVESSLFLYRNVHPDS